MATDSHRNALKPGYMLHWYRIEKILGQGGFGITYLAEDTNLNQQVAVKEYLPIEVAVREGDFSVHPVSENHSESYSWGLERFVDEARTLARFDHPNIVRVLSVFEMNNTAYMVMRYEHGRSLQQHLSKRATIEEQRLTEMLFPVLEGLERVHAAGFIHRDVKPANIFIREDGTPVLLDFGSARQSLGEATRTLTTLVSPGYAPFEQYFSKSDRQGPWTDIYGLGATFYRAVTGVAPMNAVDRSEGIIKRGLDSLAPAAEAAAGSYSPHVLHAIDWAVRFHEDARPQNISDWRQALEGKTVPPAASEAPTAVAGATEAQSGNVDLLLEATAQSDPAKTEVLTPKRPKRRKRYWLAGIAAMLLVFVGLNAAKPDRMGQAADARARETETALIQPAVGPAPPEEGSTQSRSPENAAETSVAEDYLANAPSLDQIEAQNVETESQPAPLITENQPTAAPTKETQIARLLEEAGADIDQLRLSTPPGNNALEKYRQILALDPQNQQAKTGVHKIVKTYAELGKQAAKRKDYDRASFFFYQALAIAPNSRPLKKAQRRLNRIKRRSQ
ncbi:MAG: protein kinase [Gammaproteobacteria bacterium]|nr:protein kinase [Gammaproteobacteria bacterium]MDH3413545.1 protein kinase [Gammaproteobacteria bacterium]